MRKRFHKGTVLVIDDEDAVRESIALLLEIAGYLVLAASNGVEALRRSAHLRAPAVAVVDLTMPVMDGRELIEAMRKSESLRSIPIILISGRDHPAVEGVDAVLIKPFRGEKLIALVAKLSATSRQSQDPAFAKRGELRDADERVALKRR